MTRLSSDEHALLMEVVTSRAPELSPLVTQLAEGRRVTAVDTKPTARCPRPRTAATGIDASVGAVNDRGVRLDDLIDRIARLSDLWRT